LEHGTMPVEIKKMKMFGNSVETPTTTLQLFEPDARAVYTLEQAARLTQLPRRQIAVFFKHGLVSPVMDPACGGWYFNDEAIRILRRIDYLRTACGLNLVGIKLMMDLAREVEQLREELNFLRRR
jgi:DNA-binding transcriptional MerR regulator